MPRHKQPSATDPQSHKNQSSKATGSPDSWKWKTFGFIAFLLVVALLWTTGLFQNLFAGPKVPLPRSVLNLSLGMTMDEVLEKYPDMNLGGLFEDNPKMTLDEILKKHHALKKKLPELRKTLRPFNNDPLFGITTLSATTGLTEAASVDLLFFKGKLYFMSVMWETEAAKKLPVLEWAKQYRRWNKKSADSTENLGSQAVLKEWHFDDKATEMVLRDLDYSDQLKCWQDLRDASDEDAQAAFSKYRLESGGSN